MTACPAYQFPLNPPTVAIPKLSPRRFAFIALAVLLGVVAVGVGGAAHNWSDLDPATGAWVTLADDLARDGTLYRPLVSPDGSGGTRYMPLAFVVHAILLKLGLPAIGSGLALGFIWGGVLLAGTWRLLRTLDTAREDAVIGVGLVLAAGCIQSGLTAIKGDLPATALNVWGLAVAAGWMRRMHGVDRSIPSRWPVLASLLFAAAFMTKVTTVFGCAAVVAVLVCQRRWRDALRLSGLAVLLALAAVWVTQVCSGGRFIETLLTCGGGRGTAGYFLSAPWQFWMQATRNERPFIVALPLTLGAVLLARRHTDWRACPLPLAMLMVTFVATVAILGSPGTGRNHLMDLHVALVVAATVATSRMASRPAMRYGLPGVLALASAVLATTLLPQTWHPYDRQHMNATLVDLSDVHGPILSEEPLFEIARGQRPYCLDWFAYLTIISNRPDLREPLWRDIASQRFGAIVFLQDSTASGDFVHASDTPFMAHLLKTYRLARRHGGYCVFRVRMKAEG
jgi:hypothetical protein